MDDVKLKEQGLDPKDAVKQFEKLKKELIDESSEGLKITMKLEK